MEKGLLYTRMQTIKICTNEPDSNSGKHLFNSIPCPGSTSAASESWPQKWPKMHTKQLHRWDWHSCQVSSGRKWVMLGREHLNFSQFYFAFHFSSALRVWELHHSTFHMLDRSLIPIQIYVYRRQEERTQHLAAIYPLIYTLVLPLSTWYAEYFPELHTQWLASVVLCLKPLPRNF